MLDNVQLTRSDRRILWALQKADWSRAECEENTEAGYYKAKLERMPSVGKEDIQCFIDKMQHSGIMGEVIFDNGIMYAMLDDLHHIDIYIHECVE